MWAPQNIGQSAQGLNAETANDLQAFIAKNGSPQWNAALDTGGVTIKFGITQVDSTVVLDCTGNIVFENIGPPGYQPLGDALAKVVMYILWRLILSSSAQVQWLFLNPCGFAMIPTYISYFVECDYSSSQQQTTTNRNLGLISVGRLHSDFAYLSVMFVLNLFHVF